MNMGNTHCREKQKTLLQEHCCIILGAIGDSPACLISMEKCLPVFEETKIEEYKACQGVKSLIPPQLGKSFPHNHHLLLLLFLRQTRKYNHFQCFQFLFGFTFFALDIILNLNYKVHCEGKRNTF